MSDKRNKKESMDGSVAEAAAEVLFGAQPLRVLITHAMRDNGVTTEALAAALGFTDDKPVRLYLKGLMKLPINRAEQVAHLLGLDLDMMLRIWLKESYPDLLALLDRLPAPPLLTAGERRMIEQVRHFTSHPDAELVVADAADLIAVVMSR